ncbi:hypothetical protein [Nocardioides aurantiacus]|uniref:Uncharacterized protein n=1 Tax=Nocardioides aurantiacus TaxID=86796 RepID=A0A3N2CTI6_9ACTN|nr:hypothetical protein [Nocardioides aurantiacus]ROR90843.1 hypothetical protein EDD33_1691 [Nocardioides aurantiacus]
MADPVRRVARDPVTRARGHRAALRALATRLSEEYADVATPGRVVAAAHRADRACRASGDGGLADVEERLRTLLDALRSRRDLLPRVRLPAPVVPHPRRATPDP